MAKKNHHRPNPNNLECGFFFGCSFIGCGIGWRIISWPKILGWRQVAAGGIGRRRRNHPVCHRQCWTHSWQEFLAQDRPIYYTWGARWPADYIHFSTEYYSTQLNRPGLLSSSSISVANSQGKGTIMTPSSWVFCFGTK